MLHQSYRKIREEEVSILIRDISEHEGSVMNLSAKIFTLTNSVVVRAAFAKKTENTEDILQTMERVIKLASGLLISNLYPSMKFVSVTTGMRGQMIKVHKDIDRVLENIIKDHKERKGHNVGEMEEDLVDVLLRIQKDNDLGIALSLNNIKVVIYDILVGRTETSATIVVWAMSELLKNPEAMKVVQVEVRRVFGGKGYVDESELHQLEYLGAVIKETLRLHLPIPLLVPRENGVSCEISGYEIPPKMRIIINTWALRRDSKIWNEPERFEPKRFLNPSIDYNFKGLNF